MIRCLIILISLLLLAGCADSSAYVNSYNTPNAAATLSAAELAHERAANDATAQSAELVRRSAVATETAQLATQAAKIIVTSTAQVIAQAQTATADSLAVRASEQAISAQATYDTIAANATGTAVAQVAAAERYLVEDEARRLALQREAETAAIEYQRRMNEVKVFLWGGLVLALIILAVAAAYVLYQRSRPMTVADAKRPARPDSS